jgi:Male sterility protein
MQFVNEKITDLYDSFQHFTRNEWIYETKKLIEFDARMTAADRLEFYVDPRTYSWVEGTHLYGYGIEKYMNKQDIV